MICNKGPRQRISWKDGPIIRIIHSSLPLTDLQKSTSEAQPCQDSVGLPGTAE